MSPSANLLRWQLLGAARSTISDADEARRTGVSAEAYWEARSSFWTTYFDDQRYPAMAAVWAAGGFDDPNGWDVEPLVTRLLDGIERSARSRSQHPISSARSGAARSAKSRCALAYARLPSAVSIGIGARPKCTEVVR